MPAGGRAGSGRSAASEGRGGARSAPRRAAPPRRRAAAPSRDREAGGRQHEKRFKRRVDAQRWLDEQTSAIVTQTWTAPERGRATVEAGAGQGAGAAGGP